MILEKVAIALSVMFLCTLVHAVFMMAGNQAVSWRLTKIGSARRPFRRVVLIWLIIMWMFTGTCIEAGIWAAVYMYYPSMTSMFDAQSAFYFSMVTYTTLGYGDIVLTGNWRVLSAIEAANGIIIFGWTTALIFYFIQKIYKTD